MFIDTINFHFLSRSWIDTDWQPDKDHVIASSNTGAGLKDENDVGIQAEDVVTNF